ncbi:hypothetical protein ACWGNM_26920 [Streptomyces sp. NPDC055796]
MSAARPGRADGMPQPGREKSAYMYGRLTKDDQDFPHEELKCAL